MAIEKVYESLVHVAQFKPCVTASSIHRLEGMSAKVLNDFNSQSDVNRWRVKHMNSFKSTVERIKALESERRNLLLEIEELKKMADSKANALEHEVSDLREEVKSLRILLSSDQPEPEFEPKKKQPRK